jgi:hypothetical protein
VVQRPIGTPWFQVQKHQLKTTRNSWGFDPLGKGLIPKQNHHKHKRKGVGFDSSEITSRGDEKHQEEDHHKHKNEGV